MKYYWLRLRITLACCACCTSVSPPLGRNTRLYAVQIIKDNAQCCRLACAEMDYSDSFHQFLPLATLHAQLSEKFISSEVVCIQPGRFPSWTLLLGKLNLPDFPATFICWKLTQSRYEKKSSYSLRYEYIYSVIPSPTYTLLTTSSWLPRRHQTLSHTHCPVSWRITT